MPGYLTHAYFASRFSKDPNYILGSIAPDFTLLLFKDPNHFVIQGFIIYLNSIKENKNLINGLRNHVLFDKYMHGNYIYIKAKILSKKIKIPEEVSHGLLELAIDMDVYQKDSELYDEINSSLNYIKEGPVMEYLSKYLIINKKDIKKALKDSCKIINLKNPFSTKSLFRRAFILRKYYHMKALKGISFFKLKKSFIEVKKEIKGYEKEIDRAYKFVKKELRKC